MKYLLDTNVVSEFQRPQPDANVAAWILAQAEEEMCISTISLAEVRRGIAMMPDGRRKRELDHWLKAELPQRFERRVIDVTPAVADQWGETMAGAKRQGVGLDPMDGFIAATAKALNLTLATRNIKDFDRLGIALKNPWLAEG